MSCFIRLSFLYSFKFTELFFFSFFFHLLCLHCLLVLNLQLSIPHSSISLLKFLTHVCVFFAWSVFNKLTAGTWYLSIHPYIFQLWKNWIYSSEINFSYLYRTLSDKCCFCYVNLKSDFISFHLALLSTENHMS